MSADYYIKHLAEDYSKAGTTWTMCSHIVQTALSINWTSHCLAKARDGERDMTILISQAYGMAQFCIEFTPCQSILEFMDAQK